MSPSSTAEWPPKSGLSTPTVPASRAVFSVSHSLTINAPAALVFDLICDSSSYPSWNSWISRVTILSQPEGEPSDSTRLVKGTSFVYHVVMDESKPDAVTDTQLRVSDVSTPDNQSDFIDEETRESNGSYTSDLSKIYRISWNGEGTFLSRGLQTERFHELIILSEGSCEVRTWEVMGGVLARAVKWWYQKTLNEKFGTWCKCLKKISEEKYSAQKSGST